MPGAGRAFGKAIHDDHERTEGLLYAFCLTGADVYAVFDRGTGKLGCRDSGMLLDHPKSLEVLSEHGTGLVMEQRS